ncbi:MAG: peptidoglycan bridge formation glycyltransferase FemA/FemB family protein [Candidatus Nealsonbacteria bacterium]
MKVIDIQNKDIWENFFLDYKDKTFLQSWNWGEFNLEMGNKIWRLGILNEEKLIGLALISKIKAKRGTFLLMQHGPTIHPLFKKEALSFLLKKLKVIGKEENADFIRMNPLLERNEENKLLLKELGFKKSPIHASAYESTWKLDINPLEEDILSEMRKTTRYLIRQTSNNKDIVIEKSEKLEDIDIYQKLNREVAKRHKFVSFSSESVKNEFKVFLKDEESVLFFGKYKGEITSAALLIFWSGIGFYHQAASDSKYAKFSIPYLLQWEAIKEAQKRGCAVYDFWGYVDPKKEPKHPWAGPTLFKMGFGGEGYEYIKTQDYPLSGKYLFINIFENLRKIKRGL